MRILITGKNGFIGKELSKHFVSKGYDVVAIGREDLELTNPTHVSSFFSSIPDFDVVFHCAIVGSRRNKPMDADGFYQNLLAFENIKNSIIYRDTKFVVFGSGAEFDKSKHISDVDMCDLGKSVPTDYYGLSKYLITRSLIYSNNENWCVPRLFGCFGSTESDERFIKSAIRCLTTGETFILDQDKYMDYFYVKDVLKICDDILSHSFTRAQFSTSCNLCYSKKYRLSEILEMIDPNIKYEIKNPTLGLSYTGRCEVMEDNLVGLQGGIDEMKTQLI